MPVTRQVPPGILEEASRYPTLRAFLKTRPSYIAWIRKGVPRVLDSAPRRFTGKTAQSFWSRLSPDGEHFIAAAVFMVEQLEISESDLMEPLKVLIQEWRSA